jgi:hypothetical protein
MYTFLIILLLSGCGVFESSSTLPTPASPSKQIISNNLPLREFEALTGRLIWESEPTFERPDSIAVDDNNVYASGSDATPITIIAFWKK